MNDYGVDVLGAYNLCRALSKNDGDTVDTTLVVVPNDFDHGLDDQGHQYITYQFFQTGSDVENSSTAFRDL